MPKYYIKSGQIKYIIDCNDEDSAIMSALDFYKDKKVYTAANICVSETGFINTAKWKCFDIQDYIKRLK